jgi:GNAT superfamily N-acetyltransferase
MITIRKATLKDLEKLTLLFVDIAKYHKKLDPKQFDLVNNLKSIYSPFVKKSIYSKNILILVAEINEKIIGMIRAEISGRAPVFKDRKIGNISDAYVSPVHRKKGILGLMEKEVVKWLKARKIKKVKATVYFANKDARKIWNKKGFKDQHANMVKFI